MVSPIPTEFSEPWGASQWALHWHAHPHWATACPRHHLRVEPEPPNPGPQFTEIGHKKIWPISSKYPQDIFRSTKSSSSWLKISDVDTRILSQELMATRRLAAPSGSRGSMHLPVGRGKLNELMG